MATLYRKYRSKTFSEVIGQDPIIKTLTNQVKLGRIGHAYLFTGSRGTGKTSCARIFARAVNCLHPIDGSPCGECEVCKKLESPENVDIIEMDAASNNGVDDARDIRERVKYMPVSCKYKVYIIDEAHMLTGGAFNALLKTIEEPPDHVIFILATTEPQKLPQTILSRCIRFDFRLVPTDILAAHISRIYAEEGVKCTPEAAFEIARQGAGSVRDALSVADAIMSAADEITPETVRELTGAGDNAGIARLFDGAVKSDVAGALGAVDMFAKRGKSMAAVAHQLTVYARNVLVVKSVGDQAFSRDLVSADRATQELITASAAASSLTEISAALESFAAAESGLKYSVDPRVYLETALIRLMNGASELQNVIKRVTALENKLSALPAEQKKNNRPVAPAPTVPAAEVFEAPVPEPPPEPFERARPAAQPERQTAEIKVDRPEPREPAPEQTFEQKRTGGDVRRADEGEFMQFSATAVSGMELYGGVARYLRKKGTFAATHARELLSHGVVIKERPDAIAFVAPDEIFLSLNDSAVIAELDAALSSCGVSKKARPEKTAEDKLADDMAKARELFGADLVG